MLDLGDKGKHGGEMKVVIQSRILGIDVLEMAQSKVSPWTFVAEIR